MKLFDLWENSPKKAHFGMLLRADLGQKSWLLRLQKTENSIQNTEYRIQNTEHSTQNTKHRISEYGLNQRKLHLESRETVWYNRSWDMGFKKAKLIKKFFPQQVILHLQNTIKMMNQLVWYHNSSRKHAKVEKGRGVLVLDSVVGSVGSVVFGDCAKFV